MELVRLGVAFAFPFPLGEVVWLPFEDADRMPDRIVSGKNTAAQRSNSRQSNKDFANRYRFISFDSSCASSGSRFPVTTIWGIPSKGTSVICESSGSDISSFVGIDVRSSAALQNRQLYSREVLWPLYHFADWYKHRSEHLTTASCRVARSCEVSCSLSGISSYVAGLRLILSRRIHAMFETSC